MSKDKARCENRRYDNLASQCEKAATSRVHVTGQHMKDDGSGTEMRETPVFDLCDGHAAAVDAAYTGQQIPHRIEEL